PVSMTSRALATKLQPVPRSQVEVRLAQVAPKYSRPMQGLLFPERPGSNVIPIAAYAPVRVETRPRARAEPGSRAPSKPAVKRPKMGAGRCPGTPDGQGSLDFLPSMPAQPRK